MISELKSRAPVSIRPKEPPPGLKIGKWIYLGLLATFVVFLSNYFLGSTLFLQADGLVLQRYHTVAPLFDARVVSVFVKPGQSVKKGQLLAKLQSPNMSRSIAQLTAQHIQVAAQRANLQSKLLRAVKLLPILREREVLSKERLQKIQALKARRLVNDNNVQSSVMEQLSSRELLIRLRAEIDAFKQELKIAEDAHKQAGSTLNELTDLFAGGEVTSPVDGVVGPRVASTGDVLVNGAHILRLQTGSRYVLAYLPDEYLFGVDPGSMLAVASGRSQSNGVVSQLLPVTDSLPPEFQNTFQPRERSQLARIVLASDHKFLTHQKVRISHCLTRSCEPLNDAIVKAMNSVRERLAPVRLAELPSQLLNGLSKLIQPAVAHSQTYSKPGQMNKIEQIRQTRARSRETPMKYTARLRARLRARRSEIKQMSRGNSDATVD